MAKAHQLRARSRTVPPEEPSHARILRIVARIPRGRIATYGQIARLAELPGQARLVGYALHALPDFTPVPWQRVVNARGEISTRGSHGDRQRRLLEREGVVFDVRGRISLDRFQWRPRAAGSRRKPRAVSRTSSSRILRGAHMHRDITLLGAPSAIGIKPYDDGTTRRLDLAPAALRDQGLVQRLDAHDLGDVLPPPYRDFVRPSGRPRNEAGVAEYSRALASRLVEGSRADAFTLVVGGDCSIILGCLLAARHRRSRVGLVYVDAHADFATPELSRSGSAASMCLALAVGRGDTMLARLGGDAPLVRAEDVIVIGRRDEADSPVYGQADLRAGPALDLTMAEIRDLAPGAIARRALDRLTHTGVDGFWVHLDADVIDPAFVPAVDSPEPGGLSIDDLATLAAMLAEDPRAMGLDLSIYDPGLDADGGSAGQLATLLERALRPLRA